MTTEEQRALLAVALLAAFADGDKSEAEREEVKRISSTLGGQAAGLNIPALMQDVLLKRLGLLEAVAALRALEQRQLAYELAVCVCDADGAQTPAERQFLVSLKSELGGTLDTAFEAQADGLAREIDTPAATSAGAGCCSHDRPRCAGQEHLQPRRALRRARTAATKLGQHGHHPAAGEDGAWIAQVHGITNIDAGMVKEFIATAGVGLTGQYLEQFGRKLVGGLLGSVLGGLGRGVGSLGTGMAMSFATTYALGQLAVRYYGGGRQMSTALLQQTYQDLLVSARQLQQQALPQIQQQARTLDAGKVLEMVRKPMA